MVGKKNKLTKQPSPVSLKACEERTGKNINNSSIISWLANSTKNNQFVYNSEIYEIDSDEESDDFECNLKELEKPLNSLLRKHPDKDLRKRVKCECEWDKCTFETTDKNVYINHVLDHLKTVSFTDSSLKCKWNLCKFECSDDKMFLIHLDYHAYHTRLKTFGLGLSNTISIPHCQNNSKLRNNIPSLNSEYVCYWSACGEAYTKFHDYLEHVTYHLTSDYETGVCPTRHSRPNLTDIKVDCKWDDCDRTLPNVFQLKRHVRVHTNEKMIGCANCGKLFVSKPQYLKHCIRQVVNQGSFQCPDCFKSYPSAKILKDHTAGHVNKYQCKICGLSCQKNSSLARHIRFRHMTEKPFACNECDYRAKTKNDLELHQNVHKDGNPYKCQVFQCNYSSKTLMALKRHDAKEHLGQPQTYQCHCCSKRYMRGYILSKHLMKEHQFKLAPGHSRFIYKRDIDGFYRLQTKRVENLKSANEVLGKTEEEDINVKVTYELEDIVDKNFGSPVNIKVNKILQPKVIGTPLHLLTEESTDKDINDFAVVRKYKRNMKRK